MRGAAVLLLPLAGLIGSGVFIGLVMFDIFHGLASVLLDGLPW